MLGAVYQALEVLPVHKITDIFPYIDTGILSKTELEFLEQIAGHIERHGEITNYRAQVLTNRSAESIKKLLVRLAQLGILDAVGENKGRRYVIRNQKQKE